MDAAQASIHRQQTRSDFHRHLSACLILLLTLLAAQPSASAQSPLSKDATLDDLLLRMGRNQLEFTANLPSFFCSEHAISESLITTPFNTADRRRIVSDSIFRLQRRSDRTHGQYFNETRLIQKIDGKPASDPNQSLNGPVLLYGVFAYGLRLLSVQETACMQYRLLPRKRDTDQIVIKFKDRPDHERAPSCPVSSHSDGAAVIDPITLHIVRLNQRIPNYEILPGVFSEWRWTADYSPIKLGDNPADPPYWLPATIHSIADKDRTWWRFDATYQSCHKMQSASRILPNTLKTVPEP